MTFNTENKSIWLVEISRKPLVDCPQAIESNVLWRSSNKDE